MAPGPLSLLIRRGDPWSFTFSSEFNGVPEPIDPAEILAQIRPTPDGVVLVDLAVHATVDVTGFIATLCLDGDETAMLTPGCYVWDLQPAENQETWLAGDVEISADVSRPVAP